MSNAAFSGVARSARVAATLLVLATAGACAPTVANHASSRGEPSRAEPAPELALRAPASPWSDEWILAEGTRFRQDDGYRRAALERSLVNHDNTYSRIRLDSYGFGTRGWDKLPVWNPRSRPVTSEVGARLERGEQVDAPAAPLWDGVVPETMAGWVALGREVFFRYPMRAEIYMEWVLEKPEVAAAVGIQRDREGGIPGLVVFADVDRDVRVGITCAMCHSAVENGEVVAGAARRAFDYGRLRLAYSADVGIVVRPGLARRMGEWGPGRADVTEDDDEDPVAIPDLWGLREQRWLNQAGTIRHEAPAALAIRQETQLIDSNHALTRPPRALAWALATYVYSLAPPQRKRDDGERTRQGAEIFREHCAGCHANPAHGGGTFAVDEIGTDPALARSKGRGTGVYRVPSLVRVAAGAPYLHDGSVSSLKELLSPARLRPDYAAGRFGTGPVAGHAAGTSLGAAEREALIAFLETF